MTDIYKDFHLTLSELREAYKRGVGAVHCGWVSDPMDSVRQDIEFFKRKYVEGLYLQEKERADKLELVASLRMPNEIICFPSFDGKYSQEYCECLFPSLSTSGYCSCGKPLKPPPYSITTTSHSNE